MNARRIWVVLVLFILVGPMGCQGNDGTDTDHIEEASDDTVDETVDETVEEPCDDINNEVNEGEEDRVGFEIIEQLPDGTARAWISPAINFSEFEALELPDNWVKNQPRESPVCGADQNRFLKSPDGEGEGDILVEEHFGFMWFHGATVTQLDVPLDDGGLLRGIMVKKYHELT